MVASSMAKAVDDADTGDADDRGGAFLPQEKLPTMTAVAPNPARNARPLRALNSVTSLAVCIVLRRAAAVNRSRHAPLWLASGRCASMGW